MEGVGWTLTFKASILQICLWVLLRMNCFHWAEPSHSEEQQAREVHQTQLFPSCLQNCWIASNIFGVCSWNPIVRTPGVLLQLCPVSWSIAGHPLLPPPSLFCAAEAPWLDFQLLKQDLGVRPCCLLLCWCRGRWSETWLWCQASPSWDPNYDTNEFGDLESIIHPTKAIGKWNW